MAGNGSYEIGTADNETERNYFTIDEIEGIQILEHKNRKIRKLPEESHTPNRIYATFKKDGSDVKAIAKYGPDGKKIFEIHTADHRGLKPHFHYWKDVGQEEDAHALTEYMKYLLTTVRNFNK